MHNPVQTFSGATTHLPYLKRGIVLERTMVVVIPVRTHGVPVIKIRLVCLYPVPDVPALVVCKGSGVDNMSTTG